MAVAIGPGRGGTGLWFVVLLTMAALAGCVGPAPGEAASDSDDGVAVPDPMGATGARIGPIGNATDALLVDRLSKATGTYYSIGDSTFEPTVGATSTGGLFMTSYAGLGSGTLILRSLDDGQSWEDVTPRLPTGMKAVPNSNDPFMFVDALTDRVYDFDMCIILQGFCVAYSDDDGDSWMIQSIATGEAPALDHQSAAAAPPRDGPDPVGYPNVLVFCVNRGSGAVGAWCSTSLDGGIAWTPLVPGYPVGTPQCSGLHGHIVGSVDGRFYRGNPSCDGPAVYRSEDGGFTWTEHTISTDVGARGHEVAAATDAEGNVYAFWIGDDGLPYLSGSADHAETWSEPVMVGSPEVTAAGFPTLAAGAAGRVAWAYIGTDVDGGFDGDAEQMNWTGYIGISVDALDGLTFANVPVNAADDPLDEGRACGAMRCGGFGDFIDITIDANGRPWAGMANNGKDPNGIVGTLATGPSLVWEGDLPPLPMGGAAIWD